MTSLCARAPTALSASYTGSQSTRFVFLPRRFPTCAQTKVRPIQWKRLLFNKGTSLWHQLRIGELLQARWGTIQEGVGEAARVLRNVQHGLENIRHGLGNIHHGLRRAKRLLVLGGGGPKPFFFQRCIECDRTFKMKLSQKAWFEFNGLKLPERCQQCREFRKLTREHGTQGYPFCATLLLLKT
jgi:hypothetical protein